MTSNTKSLPVRMVKWYQRRISPLFPARCKFYPTCSQYTVTAISRFGFFRGGLLGTLRLVRCQPWVDGGIDDVPQKYSLFYRFSWSKAHEEPRLTPIIPHSGHNNQPTQAKPENRTKTTSIPQTARQELAS